MEEPEMVKEWYVTHEGKQFGPVSLDDLKFEAERGELNPRLDMVWKEGMKEWMPSGDLEAVFTKNKEAEKKEVEGSSFTEFDPEESKTERMKLQGKWGGASRSTFIFLCYIFPILWIIGVGYAATFLKEKLDEEILRMATLGFYVLPFIIVFMVVLQRFRNLGMSRAWFLGLIVPFLNWWLCYRLIACPEGYQDHKKLDTIGWVLAILYWLPFVGAVLFGVFAAVVLSNAGPEDPYRVAIENYVSKIEELRTAEKPLPAE
ncbi:MAG: DUF4339 domain-containing protein [Luteolibacter sp.]